MAAETCRAGGLGLIPAGYNTNVKDTEEQIQVFLANAPSDAPLCLGFIGYAALHDNAGWERYRYLLDTYRPCAVQYFAPSVVTHEAFESNVALAHQYDAQVIAQVGTVKEADVAVQAGVDALIAQGSEAGGHGIRRNLGNSTLSLSSLLVKRYGQRLPVLVAGGIMTGQHLAAALALGCHGVVLGTRLWASRESIGSPSVQTHLLNKTCDDVIRTTVFDQINNVSSTVPWPQPYDSVGALRNDYTDIWDERYGELQAELENPNGKVLEEFNKAQNKVDPQKVRVLCGEGVGHIESIEGTYDIILQIESDAKETIRGLSSLLPE